MNVYIILIFISDTLAYYEPNGFHYNVGTVLFTSSDIYKNTWTKNQIGLLRARRYFQTSIPPIDLSNELNDDFIDKLIDYLKQSYTIVKKEASNPVDDAILTTALSDVIGGYLKIWALPITRYAFYGGLISSDQALKLHRFYKDVKNYLGTDGTGWRGPDPNLLASLQINVNPRRVTNTRSTLDPCDNLAFFEKSSNGLSVPVPYVNWEDRSYTMFIPLKNQSLISLTSPKTTDALCIYYDTAKNCIKTSNDYEQNNFDDKFQFWLSKDVIPHLNDDNLYLAFGNILSLVNKTKNLCDTVIDLSASSITNSRGKFNIAGFPINLTSKKMMIISIIILLEIVWCIPALIYMVCMKRKKVKHNENNFYVYLPPKNKKDKQPKNIQTTSRVEVDIGTNPDPTITAKTAMTCQKLKKNNAESKVKQRQTTTGCASSFIAKAQDIDTKLINYESRSMQLKSPIKKNSVSTNQMSVSSQEILLFTPDKVSLSQCESYSTAQILDTTKTITLLEEKDKNNRNSRADIKAENRNVRKDKKFKKQSQEVISKDEKVATVKSEEVKRCLCTCSPSGTTSISKKDSKIIDLTEAAIVASSSKCSIKNSQPINNLSRVHIEKETKSSKHREVKSSCNNKQNLEITINQEQKDLEIPGTTKKDKTKNISELKPSKIPTRAMYCQGYPTFGASKRVKNPINSLGKKSLIPQLKKRPADDSEIKEEKAASKDSKLNITL